MNGIFVNPDDRFDVTVYYEIIDGKVKIIDAKKDNCQSLTLTCQFPDYATSQRIVQSSMVKAENGQSMDVLKLRANMLYFLAVGWDVKNKDGEISPFSTNELDKLHAAIASALIDLIQEKITKSGHLSM